MQEKLHKTILSNGIRIISKKIPYLRSVSMGVWVSVGARDEIAAENGISHFIEHIIFKGTAKRSAFDIAREFDAIGGQTNAFTSMETTCYHARVSDVHFDKAADILSDILLNSAFEAQEIDRERMVIYQEIGMVEDSPEDYIHILSDNALWKSHPLGRSILGTRENVLKFDSGDLRNFFGRFYSPDRIVISLAGNIDHNHAVDLLAPSFESFSDDRKNLNRTAPLTYSGVSVYPKDSEQVQVCMATNGLPLTDPKRYAFSLMNIILGGNMSSRLIQEIRERRGLAYSVYSFISSYTDTGVFGTCAGVDPNNVRETIKLTLNELRRLKTEPVSPSELKDAKEYAKGGLFLALESTDNQMIRLAQNEIHFGRDISVQEIIDGIESVTQEDVLDLARSLLEPERLSITLLGPVKEEDVKVLSEKC